MLCPKCGETISDDALFCSECGERVVNVGECPQVAQQESLDYNGKSSIEISYSIDSKKILQWFTWIGRSSSILSCLAIVSLAFDFGKIREIYIGLMLLSKQERLEEYIGHFIEMKFSLCTMILFVCFFILIIIGVALVMLTKKQGILSKERAQQAGSNDIDILINGSSLLIMAISWIWVLI